MRKGDTVKRILIIDDERSFAHNFEPDEAEVIYRRNVGDALSLLVSIWNEDCLFDWHPYGFDEIWLDHDLGDGGDIMVIVHWFASIAFLRRGFPVRKIYVHSMNPVGAENIVNRLKPNYDVQRCALPELV